MSSIKKKKRKPKTTKTRPGDERRQKKKPLQISAVGRSLIFIVGFISLGLIFFILFSQNPDFQNPLLASRKGLIAFQHAVFFWVACCFGYFGWRQVRNGNSAQWDKIILWLAFAGIVAMYVGAFNEEVSPNGDNAEYLIITKSLVERGKVLRLENRAENPNSLASIGLPLLLSPIYKIWGFDFVKMKILVMAIGISIFWLLFLLFKIHHGFLLAAMLAIVGSTSPFLVGTATDLMTETPFVFWSTLALLFIAKYRLTEKFNWRLYFLVFATIIMTFFTRANGIGILAALLLYLMLYVPWNLALSKETFSQFVSSVPFRKLAYIAIPLFVGAVVWQLRQQSTGISQAAIFFNRNVSEHLEFNGTSAFRVLGLMLFSPETFRFQNFYAGADLPKLDFRYVCILLVMLLGFVRSLREKNIIGIYTVVIFLVIIFASLTPAEMVIMRYLSVLVPFLVYLLFLGLREVLGWLPRRSRILQQIGLVELGSILLLAQVMFTNFHGNSVNCTLAALGNGPAYQDFIDVAKWAGRNLTDDAFVVSVKPRLFYVFSGKKGARLSTLEEDYSKDFEEKKINGFQKMGVTHVVLDGMSGSTRENIFPILKNNPGMFQTLYIGAVSGTSSIDRITYED